MTTVTRAHDDFLTREAATTGVALGRGRRAQHAAADTSRRRFKTGTDGLGYAAQNMFNSFVDVANKRRIHRARQVALARVGDLATSPRKLSDQLDAQRPASSPRLQTAIASVNALTSQIADLNKRIANVKGSGQAPNDLLDQRDKAINDLASWSA